MSLMDYCRNTMQDGTSDNKIDDFFEQNRKQLLQMTDQLSDAVKFVSQKPEKGYKLLIWLIRLLIAASNPNSSDHFKFIQQQVGFVLHTELLTKLGMSKLSDLQNLARDYSQFLMSAGKAVNGISQMLHLIKHVTQQGELSTFHCMYAKLSLKSLTYQQTLPLIERSYVEVQTNTSAIEVLTFYYYSGMIFMGLERFQDAISQMQKLMLLPTTTSHQVYVDAYKKLILMGVIVGVEYKLPSKTQDKIQKLLKMDDGQSQGGHHMGMMRNHDMHGLQAYQSIQNYSNASQYKNVLNVISNSNKALLDDGNLGLAKKALERVRQSKVKDLGEVYVTLGFKEIQEKSGLDKDVDVEKYLMMMIFGGHMKATIDRETRTVKFTEEGDMLALVDSIEAKNRKIVDLMNAVAARDKTLRTDQEYLVAMVKGQPSGDEQRGF